MKTYLFQKNLPLQLSFYLQVTKTNYLYEIFTVLILIFSNQK